MAALTGSSLPMRSADAAALHAFLAGGPDDDVRMGDVAEFGISHPCTTLQLYRFMFATNPAGRVTRAIPMNQD